MQIKGIKMDDTDDQKLTPEQMQAKDKEQAQKFLSLVTDRMQWLEKHWWKMAKDSDKIYSLNNKAESAPMDVDVPFNILYSNTEVLLPSLYSATPKPDVRSRFKGADLKPIPEVCERFLELSADGVAPGQESLDDALKDATLSALVPGAGIIRLRKYDDQEFPIRFESVKYDHFIVPKGQKWASMEWVAFKHDLPNAVLMEQMGIDEEEFEAGYEPQDQPEKTDCCVYEFWHKKTRTVWFLSPDWKDKFFKKVPDPLQLVGFFPTPGYLMLTMQAGEYLPTPLYQYYKNQAEELNRVSVRLNKVLSAIKVRGTYNGLLGPDLANLLQDADSENKLIEAKEAGLLAQNGGFDKQIWLLPIEKLVLVAQQLYMARESIKQVIYELTGISDIIRGSSVASETATAQDLKNKWGTVRLRKMQTIVANYARDLFRMAIDCGSKTVPPETWKKIVQLPIPMMAEKQAAQQKLQMDMQMMQEQAQQMQAMGQQPSPPPQPDPKLLQAAQSPSWEEILQQISSDQARTFTINIQTSSTIDLDTASDKQEVSEFMNAMGQLMAGLQPLVQLGPQGFAVAKQILISVCQRFKFGIDIADVMQNLQPPPPPQPDQGAQMEIQVKQAESQAKMQEIQAKSQQSAQEHKFKMEEMAMKQDLLRVQTQAAIAKAKASMATTIIKAQQPKGNTNASV